MGNISVKIDITFRTLNVISQETGLDLWRNASYFSSVSGNRTYRLQANVESDTLQSAIQFVIDDIESTVCNASSNTVVIKKVVAETT